VELSRKVFRASLLVALVVVSAVLGALAIAPGTAGADFVLRTILAFSDFRKAGFFAPPFLIVEPAPDAGPPGVFIPDPAVMPKGWRAIMAFDVDAKIYVVSLYDEAGIVAHQWPVLDPSGFDKFSARNLITPHGLIVGRDGSIIVNSDAIGVLKKIDRCGRQVWRREDWHHHEMSTDDEGYIWSWRGEGSNESSRQWIDRLDPLTGKTVESISLNDEILKSHDDQIAILGVGLAPADSGNPDADIFHPNDVEILTRDLAPHFPMFNAGDMLISLRNLDTIAVIDRRTHKIKWFARGPWRRQHDPDFTETGEISVFNNNFPGYGSHVVDREASSILAIDPATGHIRQILGPEQASFFSQEMGAHSWVTNQVISIVTPFQARVIEFDLAAGDTIFEYNNEIREGVAAHVAMAVWLPPNYFEVDFSNLRCDPINGNNIHR